MVAIRSRTKFVEKRTVSIKALLCNVINTVNPYKLIHVKIMYIKVLYKPTRITTTYICYELLQYKEICRACNWCLTVFVLATACEILMNESANFSKVSKSYGF